MEGVSLRAISPRREIIEKQMLHQWTVDPHSEGHRGRFKYVVYAAEFLIEKTGILHRGQKNALDLIVNNIEFKFVNLPPAFDGFRILFISDLHIDKLPGLTDRLLEILGPLKYDFCLMGGDYVCDVCTKGDLIKAQLTQIINLLTNKSPVVGILGNHDIYYYAQLLNSLGVIMLVNENYCLRHNGQNIFIVGPDDNKTYKAADAAACMENIDSPAFKILLCHSPDCIKLFKNTDFDLCLSGHTHGGQMCLPGGLAMIVKCSGPRSFIRGRWKYRNTPGYTTTGAGSSGVPARFFCRPEVVLLTLRKTE